MTARRRRIFSGSPLTVDSSSSRASRATPRTARQRAHRDAYYDGLLGVSRDGDWTGWCEFFLDALRAQAEENLKKTRAILALHASMAEQLADLTRSQHASRALAWIFAKPVFPSSDFARSSKIPTPTAHRFLTVLRDAGVLKTVKTARGKLAAVLAFPALVNIVEGRKVF